MGPLPGPGEGRVEWAAVPCDYLTSPITLRYLNNEPFFQRLVFQV